MKKPDTTKRLEEALSEAPPEEREDLRTMWDLSANADESPNIDKAEVDALWDKLAVQAAKQPATPSFKHDRAPVRKAGRRVSHRIWTGVVAAVILSAVGVALWLQPLTKTAPYGEQLAVFLPDGSSIELNSGSSITYPRYFSGNRVVTLQGEAYFDVEESNIPFIVRTFNADVQVLGTTFNVKAWENGWRPESKVTLTSGSIRLSANQASSQSLVMQPGQTVTVRQGAEKFIESDTQNNDHLLAWRKGELVFKDQELASVLEEIERRFGVNVELSMNQLMQKEVTFAYRQATSAESILEDLCHALDLQYRPILNGYELFEE